MFIYTIRRLCVYRNSLRQITVVIQQIELLSHQNFHLNLYFLIYLLVCAEKLTAKINIFYDRKLKKIFFNKIHQG